MTNEAQNILNEIQYRTGKSLDEIAKDIGYSRPYLNNVKLKGGGEKILGILKTQYYNVLQNVPRSTAGKGEQKEGDLAGTVPASDLIEVLKQQNEFLRDTCRTSLNTIVKGQTHIEVQLKTSLWFAALTANAGDEKKAAQAMQEISKKMSSYAGVGGEAHTPGTEDTVRTSGKQRK